MPTAQETFKAMLADEVAPRLRAIGFRGSGQTYRLPDDDAWVLIGFQKSKFSDASSIEFTLNLTVASKAAWKEARNDRPHLPDRPSANTYYGDYVWQSRISALNRDGADGTEKWWRVKAGRDTARVAADVISVLERDAVPAMQDELKRLELERHS